MADDTQVEVQAVAQAAAEAPAKVAETVAETIETVAKNSDKVAKESAKVAKESAKVANEPAKAAKRTRTVVKREAAAVHKAATEAAIKTATKASTRRTIRKTRTAAIKKVAAPKKRTKTMTKTVFNGFDTVPAFAPFQSLFNEANERSQEFVKRGQKVAEELADLARANVEAVVEAGRVASQGARTIGQDVVAKQRSSFEQAADAIRSLAEAKSPTEYMQLQSDFARASFDRAVAESSKLTESLVKLAGETFQPLSNRASANAERFNTLVA